MPLKTISLDILVNDEQLLDFALTHFTEHDDEDVHPVAHSIIIRYILNDFASKGKKDFTEEEVQEQYEFLITSHIINKLAHKGLVDSYIDDDGEIQYALTKKGKEKIEK